uniref:Non-specific serine/threonine protein kinase n=1 Tax=Caenorhabditis tropicalis TaxID=1561998 RepID=A0A1I7TLJ5_9PELO
MASKRAPSNMVASLATEVNQMSIITERSYVGLDDFEKLKVVGKGAFGKVYQVRDKCTGEILAMKVAERPRREIDKTHLKEEQRILETVKSPFLDLKANNVLLDRRGNIKLTDFGLSKRVERGTKTSTFCGTFECMAPEMIKKQPYEHSLDHWALGILMYDMLTGGPPFVGDSRAEQADRIVTGVFDAPRGLSKNCVNILRGLLTTDPNERWSFAEIKSSPFFALYNWDLAASRDFYEPPFQPKIENDEDTSQFESIFTEMSIENSPRKNGI